MPENATPGVKHYTKVQFIPWEIYTAPILCMVRGRDGSFSAQGVDYPGIPVPRDNEDLAALCQCLDIEARVAVTALAIEEAYQYADNSPDTLKIFMAPEFLYRGAAGAYLHDLLDGWVERPPFDLPAPFNGPWGGLNGRLGDLAARDGTEGEDPRDRFEDWLFVFGSAIGAASRSGASGSTVINQSLVQRGGAGRLKERCYTEKYLKSCIDYVEFNRYHPDRVFLIDGQALDDIAPTDPSKDGEILERLIIKRAGDDKILFNTGGPLFQFDDICRDDGRPLVFGLEICLDHARRRESKPDVTGRLALMGATVDIQLVPSCGMSLMPTSMALGQKRTRDITYAFNCDGNGGIPGSSLGCRLGGHVQLWKRTNDGLDCHTEFIQEVHNTNLPDWQEARADPAPPAPRYPVLGGNGTVDLTARLGLSQKVRDRLLRDLRLDISRIPPGMLWRSLNTSQPGFPEGAGYVRPLPPVPLELSDGDQPQEKRRDPQ